MNRSERDSQAFKDPHPNRRKQEQERQFFAGIKFIDLREPYLSLIRDYTLKLLCDEEMVRKQGVDRILADISTWPEKHRNRAVEILAQKGLVDHVSFESEGD